MPGRPVTHFVIKCSGHLPVISSLYLSGLSFHNKPVNHNIGDKLLKVAIYTNNRIWIFHFRVYSIWKMSHNLVIVIYKSLKMFQAWRNSASSYLFLSKQRLLWKESPDRYNELITGRCPEHFITKWVTGLESMTLTTQPSIHPMTHINPIHVCILINRWQITKSGHIYQ
jgi:hypothetical protein